MMAAFMLGACAVLVGAWQSVFAARVSGQGALAAAPCAVRRMTGRRALPAGLRGRPTAALRDPAVRGRAGGQSRKNLPPARAAIDFEDYLPVFSAPRGPPADSLVRLRQVLADQASHRDRLRPPCSRPLDRLPPLDRDGYLFQVSRGCRSSTTPTRPQARRRRQRHAIEKVLR
jgi:hypothetical protein